MNRSAFAAKFALAALLMGAAAAPASAVDRVWNGPNGGNASVGANWVGGVAPTTGDQAIFDGSNPNNSCTWNYSVSLSSLTIYSAYAASVTFTAPITVTGSVDVSGAAGAQVLINVGPSFAFDVVGGVNLSSSAVFTVDGSTLVATSSMTVRTGARFVMIGGVTKSGLLDFVGGKLQLFSAYGSSAVMTSLTPASWLNVNMGFDEIQINGAEFRRLGQNGLLLQPAVEFPFVGGLSFNQLQPGATALNFQFGWTGATTTFNNVFFDASMDVNVRAGPGFNSALTINASGPRAGPQFETDPSNKVSWPGFPAGPPTRVLAASMAPSFLNQSESDRPLLSLKVWNDWGSKGLGTLRVSLLGDMPAGLAKARVWKDANANNTLETGTDIYIGEASFISGSPSAAIVPVSQVISPSTITFFIAMTYQNAPGGKIAQVGVMNGTDFGMSAELPQAGLPAVSQKAYVRSVLTASPVAYSTPTAGPPSGGGYDTQLFLNKGQTFHVESAGTWFDGTNTVGGNGSVTSGGLGGGLFIGQLVGRIGGGAWFALNATSTITAPNSGNLFIAMSDTNYSDNSGALNVVYYIIPSTAPKRWVGGTTGFETIASIDANWVPAARPANQEHVIFDASGFDCDWNLPPVTLATLQMTTAYTHVLRLIGASGSRTTLQISSDTTLRKATLDLGPHEFVVHGALILLDSATVDMGGGGGSLRVGTEFNLSGGSSFRSVGSGSVSLGQAFGVPNWRFRVSNATITVTNPAGTIIDAKQLEFGGTPRLNAMDNVRLKNTLPDLAAVAVRPTVPVVWTLSNWEFDMSSVVNVESSGSVSGTSVTFRNAYGPKFGSTREFDPNNRIQWNPDGGGVPRNISGNFFYSGSDPGPYRIFATTSPAGLPAVMSSSFSVSANGNPYTISNLQTPATYYLFAFSRSAGESVPPPPSVPRGGLYYPGSYRSEPIFLSPSGNLSGINMTADDVDVLSGSWGLSTNQIGPIRVQAWHGGDPLLYTTSYLETSIVLNPNSSTYQLFLPQATDYYIVAYVDVDNDAFPDGFEASGSSSPVTMEAGSHPGVNLTLAGGFTAPGGFVSVASASANAGYVATDAWSGLFKISVGAVTSSASLNSLTLNFQGVVPQNNAAIGVFEDVDLDGSLNADGPDTLAAYMYMSYNGGVFETIGSTVVFFDSQRIDAGTTRHYLVGVDLFGAKAAPFSVFIASAAAFGLGAGSIGSQPFLYPISSGLVTPRFFVNAGEPASPDLTGGMYTGSTIYQGQTLVVSATGTWKRNGADSGVGPGGAAGTQGLNTVLPSANHGALIGRIENNNSESTDWFALGASTSLTASEGGVLYLAMNDFVGAYYDNSGSVAVDYTIGGSTTGVLAGTIYYTGAETGYLQFEALSGPVTATLDIFLTGATYYPYLIKDMQTSGGYNLTATVQNNPVQKGTGHTAVAAGATSYVDIYVPISTGAISGALSYSGVMPFGSFFVAVATRTNFIDDIKIVGSTSNPNAGAFTVEQLPSPATYYVVAFRSASDGDGGPKHSEPFGYFGTPGFGLSNFSTALTPIYVSTGGTTTNVNFSVFDTGEIRGKISLPSAPGGADVVVRVGRGAPGSANFAFENEVRMFYQNGSSASRDYSVELLRPATDYSVFAFLDLNRNGVVNLGEPTFYSQGNLGVPQGGSFVLDFPLSVAGPPPAPGGFIGLSSILSSTFTWNLVQGATQYDLRAAGGGLVLSLPHPTTMYADSLPANTSSQIVAVTATNFNGTSALSSIAPTFSLASDPASLTSSLIGETSAFIMWSSGGNPAGTIYALERATQTAGPFVRVALTTSTSRYDSGMAGGITYRYRVRAFNGNGIPTAYTAVHPVATNPASGSAIVGEITYLGAQAGVVRVEASTSSLFSPVTSFVTVPRMSQIPYQLPVPGLTTYHVRAYVDVNGNGLKNPGEDAGPAASLSGFVASIPLTGQNFTIVTDTVPPAAPAGLTPTPLFQQVRLNWSAPTKSADNGPLNDLLGFIVERSSLAAGPFTALSPVISTTVFFDTAPVAGVAQFYRVLARDLGLNNSAPSGSVSAAASPGGTISGTLVSFSTSTQGVYHIRLSTYSYPGAPFIADSTLPNFTFGGLADGVYYLTGFLDRDDDRVANPLDEPAGTHGGLSRPFAITIAGGNSVGGVEVVVCPRIPLTANQEKFGALANGDCPARDKSSAHVTDLYAFSVGGGGAGSVGVGSEVNLRLKSSYDNELILLAPDGTVLDRDNRAGGAGVRRVLTQPGVYLVEPTSFQSSTSGPYSLSMWVTGGFSGVLPGTVTYSGTRSGLVHVQLFMTPDPSAAPVRVSTQAAPGTFSIGGLSDGVYYVRAFRDSNGNGARDPGEANGVFGVSNSSPTPVYLFGGVPAPASAQFALTDPAAGAVVGTLVYDGAQPGPLRVEIGRKSCIDCSEIEEVLAFASTGAAFGYVLPFIAPSTGYFVQAYVDSNYNGLADTLEAKASSSTVSVVAGSTTTLSLIVLDPGFGAPGDATIVGTVTYAGSQDGPIFMAFARDPSFSQIDYVLSMSTQGSFVKTGLIGNTSYYVGAFRDVNNNSNLDQDLGEPSGLGEPPGYVGPERPVIFAELSGLTTANITLTDPPSGRIFGRLFYTGGAPSSQSLVVQAENYASQGGGFEGNYRAVVVPRTAGVTAYDYVLPFLAASSSFSVTAWVDSIPNRRPDPGESVGYFIQPFCNFFSSGPFSGCRSAAVKVSTGAGTFPTYGVNVDVRDSGSQSGFGGSGGEIRGEVIYLGVQSGPIVVRMFDNENFEGQPLFVQSIAAPPGPVSVDFSFLNVPFGQYALDAFRDTTGTGQFLPAVQDRVEMGAEVTSENPQTYTDGPALIDPGGAGSLNVYTGSFTATAGARFDGGSSDLAFMMAVDTVSVGAPYVYVAGITTQLEGLQMQIVRYSSTGVKLAEVFYEHLGNLPRLAYGDGYLYVMGATTPSGGETDGIISVLDETTLATVGTETIVLEAKAIQGGVYDKGHVFVSVQDAEMSTPDIVRKIDPFTGATIATGTFNFPGSMGTPHGDAIAVDPVSGDVYAYMTTGGGTIGSLSGLLKFSGSLGAPIIVRDVTSNQSHTASLAVNPQTGDVYTAYLDEPFSRGWIKRYNSSLVELNASSIPVAISALVDRFQVTVDDDGTVYLVGTSASGGGDYFARRYTAALQPMSTRFFDGFNGTKSDFGSDIAVYDSSNVFVTGAVNNGTNLDWATVRFNMNTSGSVSAAGQTVVITTANATSAVHGTMQYAGTLASSGTFRAALFPYGSPTPVRLASATFSGSRFYLFNNVPAGNYETRAFLDLNGNLAADAGEPIGGSGVNGFEFEGVTLGNQNFPLCDRRQVTSGVDVFDSLSASDCVSPDVGSHQRLYTFTGRRGQEVFIGVEALGFIDSYVVLYGPDGGLVAYDDDSWGDGDALISGVALDKDGLYTIAATAYDADAVGAFRLAFNGSAGTLGSISGEVDYTGSQGGQFFVGLFRAPNFSTSTVVASTVLTSTRGFTFADLATGATYYLGAFVDVNFNQIPDAGEDSGVFGVSGTPSAIFLENGQNFQGARILVDPSTSSAPSGYAVGAVTYAGTRTGPVRLEFWSSASFTGRPAALRTLPGGPGNYDVAVPGDVTYFVRAFLDSDSDFTLDTDEAKGIYAPAQQGAQAVFIPVGNSVPAVDIALRDPGTNAAGVVGGEGTATIVPSTAVAGYQQFTATISFVAGASGVATGGEIRFGVPYGYAYPQGVTRVSTSAATLGPVVYNGQAVSVAVTAGTLLPGQRVDFVYTSPYAPCEISTGTFQVSSSKDGAAAPQPLVAGSPRVFTRAGAPIFFQPSDSYIALEQDVLSEAQTLEARDQCGNRTALLAPAAVEMRAKFFGISGFAPDPEFGVSTATALSTATAVTLEFAAGESAKQFFAVASSTGYKNLEIFYDLGFEATSYVSVTVLPAGAISAVSVSTSPAGPALSSTTISPNNDGVADQAFVRFTLADPNIPWHVLLSSVPFKSGVAPIWETWGYGQPAQGSLAWDGRYSPWINGGARVPNGTYFVRIEAAGPGVKNDDLSIGVSVSQIAGRVVDGGFTPNPPLQDARLSIYGPNGFNYAQSDASGRYIVTGLSAGQYNVQVMRDDFLPGSLRMTVNGTGVVSTFTAVTTGISGTLNAEGGVDVVLSRAPALFVVPSLDVAVATAATDRWGSLQVRTATFSLVQQNFFSPLRLPAGTTTFDDGGQWDQGTQQFVRRTTMKFNVPAGSYVVEARMDGFAPSTAAVTIGASGATVFLPPMAAKASISGVVAVVANPAGLEVSVDAVPLSTGTAAYGNSVHVRLDPSVLTASYTVGGLDAGSYIVRAGAPGLLTTSTAPIVVAANAAVTAVNPPTLTAGSSITGLVSINGDTSGYPAFAGLTGVAGGVYVNAWAPGTLSFGSTFVYVLAGNNVSTPYAIPGLDPGTTYLIYANFNTDDSRWESALPQPFSALGNAALNFSFVESSGVISGTILLPAGNTDFINVSISGTIIAASRPEDVGKSFTQDGAHTLDNFRCQPSDTPAGTGYCPAANSTATFKFYRQGTETNDLTVTYKTTGDTRRLRLSTVSGSTSTIVMDLTAQTWSVSGSINNQIVNPLFNTNPRIVANAPYIAPVGYPAGLSSSTARVTAVLQDPEKFTVALSTAFDPLTSRVGFLTSAGSFTITNVPSGVYFVRTLGLRACVTCEALVPSVGRIVRVSSNVTGVAITLSDGYSVSGSFELDNGLQDSDEFQINILNRRQEVVRSTFVALGNAALGAVANSAAFSFSNLPAGEFYTLTVRSSAAVPRYIGRPIRFPDPGLSPTGLQSNLSGQNVTLLRAAYATGRLRDGGTGSLIGAGNAGLLAPTFEISATANPWVEGGYAVAASSIAGRPILADGTFRVGPLLPNVAYDVRMGQTSWDPNFLQRGSQNYTPVVVSGVTPLTGESRDLGVITLNQGQSISGVVRQSTTTGQALGGIKVTAKPSFAAASDVLVQSYTDAQGRYSLWVSSFVSNQYDVTAAPRDGNTASNGLVYGEVRLRNVTLLAKTTVDFFLTPLFGAVTGQVVVSDAANGGELSYPFGDLRGFPAAAVNLQPVGVVPTRNPLGDIEERTDASGAFSVRGLSTGTYTLRVTSLGYSVFNATVTTTGNAFQLYTGSNTPSNYLPNNTITLARGATVSGRIVKTDGSAPNTSEVAGVAAANFAAGEFVVGSVDIDRVAKTVNSYSISGFKPNVSYDLVILPSGKGEDVSFPPEGRAVSFTSAESTTTKNINLTFAATGIDCKAISKALGNTQFQVKIDCTKALRNTLPSDSDLDVVLTLSTFTTTGAAPTSPNNTGQLLGSDKALSSDRRQITAIYRAGAAETLFSLRLRAVSSAINPKTGDPFIIDKVFDIYTGLESNVTERISNMNGGSVSLEPSALDEQLGLDERSRVSLKPGTFAFGSDSNPGASVIVATATIEVGITKAKDRQAASVLYLQRYGFIPAELQTPVAAASMPSELYSAMSAYRVQASTTQVGGANPLSSFYNIFLPLGVRHQLQQAADLTFSYSTLNSTSAASDPTRINVWFYNATLGRFVLENANRRVDTVNKTITVSVDHFSVFVVLDSTPAIQAPNVMNIDQIQAVNFPNPADCISHANIQRNSALFGAGGVVPTFKGTMIRYALPPGPASEAKIHVYNLAGERVRTIEPGSLAGGFTYYSPWNCANESGGTVSSGVYIGEVSWNGKKKFFKMAIIKGSGL